MSVLSTDPRTTGPRLLTGLAPLAAAYDGFILDLWGVLHDGQRAFPAAIDCLQRLRALGKHVVLLSNAPRREAVTAARNATIGLAPDLSDGIVTSGEEAWRHLVARDDAFHAALGRRCLHIGGARDLSLREGLPYDFVERVEQADFLLNSGSAGDDGRPAAEETLLRAAAERELPMVCANPDRVVIAGGRRELCAGSLAEFYEGLGGKVAWHGKPFPGVYRRALEKLGRVAPQRVLCVGDSLLTDMGGAKAAGLDALFVWGGIHREELGGDAFDPHHLARLCQQRSLTPVAALEHFVW